MNDSIARHNHPYLHHQAHMFVQLVHIYFVYLVWKTRKIYCDTAPENEVKKDGKGEEEPSVHQDEKRQFVWRSTISVYRFTLVTVSISPPPTFPWFKNPSPPPSSGGTASVWSGSPRQSGCQRSLPVQLPVPPRSPRPSQGSRRGVARLGSSLLPAVAQWPKPAPQPHLEPAPAGARLRDGEAVRRPGKCPDQGSAQILQLPLPGWSVGRGHSQGKRSYQHLWWVGKLCRSGRHLESSRNSFCIPSITLEVRI